MLISSAVSRSIFLFEIRIPPKEETGSADKASKYAFLIESLLAIPHALLCFNIAKVVSSNSEIRFTAASMSSRLLYDNSFPLSLSKISFKFPK